MQDQDSAPAEQALEHWMKWSRYSDFVDDFTDAMNEQVRAAFQRGSDVGLQQPRKIPPDFAPTLLGPLREAGWAAYQQDYQDGHASTRGFRLIEEFHEFLQAQQAWWELAEDEEAAIAESSCPDCGGLGSMHGCRTCNPRREDRP